MKVIGHGDKSIQGNVWTNGRCSEPLVFHDFPIFIQPHLPINYLTQKTFPAVRTDGNEIPIHTRVIVVLQANGSTLVGL